MSAEQPPKMKYGDKINRIRAENGFSGGSIITKMQDDGTGNTYGPYAWLVAPPSAGRKWYHLGPVDGEDSESGVEDATQDEDNNEVGDNIRDRDHDIYDIPDMDEYEEDVIAYADYETSHGNTRILLNFKSPDSDEKKRIERNPDERTIDNALRMFDGNIAAQGPAIAPYVSLWEVDERDLEAVFGEIESWGYTTTVDL